MGQPPARTTYAGCVSGDRITFFNKVSSRTQVDVTAGQYTDCAERIAL